MTSDDTPVLTSWKEIANHLQVTVRTAQLWETQRGLPVRRVPGRRSRVYLRQDELEAWLAGLDVDNGESISAALTEASGWPSNGMLIPVVGVVGALCVLVGLLAAPLVWSPGAPTAAAPGPPATWRLAGATLIIGDDAGTELWRKTYSNGLIERHYTLEGVKPAFDDIDGDGEIEVLFAQRPDTGTDSCVLICYSADGVERWRFEPGGAISTESRNFEDVFQIRVVKVAELGLGSKSVIVATHHEVYFPSQIAVLSPGGDVLGTYWHSGQIGTFAYRLAVADFDRDGRSYIYATGVNNARAQATLVVLDPATMAGASIEADGAYQLLGFAPGQEVARVFFPRSAMNKYLRPYNVADHAYPGSDSIIIGVQELMNAPEVPVVHYELGHDLTLLSLLLTDTFAGIHETLVQDGALSLSIAEQERLLREEGVEVVRPR